MTLAKMPSGAPSWIVEDHPAQKEEAVVSESR
jgi:hypothetical protein